MAETRVFTLEGPVAWEVDCPAAGPYTEAVRVYVWRDQPWNFVPRLTDWDTLRFRLVPEIQCCADNGYTCRPPEAVRVVDLPEPGLSALLVLLPLLVWLRRRTGKEGARTVAGQGP